MLNCNVTAALKAYAVQNDFDGEGEIYFAEHDIAARRRGASDFGDGDISGMTCRRAPWADSYAPGPVPKLVMIDNGWRFECHGCGCHIDSDLEAYDDNDEPRKFQPVEIDGAIFCAEECHQMDIADRAARSTCETAAINKLTAALLAALPDVTLTGKPHAYAVKRDGVYVAKQVWIDFTFPGATIGPATYRYDEIDEDPRVTVRTGDLDAWNAWRASLKPEMPAP